MAQKFLTNIELEAGLVDGGNSTGTSGYLLSSTGTATSWVDPAAVSVGESEQVHIACKNTSGVAISKGDPVYITGTVGASFRIQIAKADASDSAKMPAVGLAETDLGLNDEGFVIVSGVLKNLTTDPLSTSDGTPSSNDTVYVKAGGGLTKTKPTGSGNLIQNVGKVGRISSANAGSLAVSTIMRTNDVPNLTTGKIWVGSPTYTTESTVVHLDETNGRMGIGTTSPGEKLEVSGSIQSSSYKISGATVLQGYTTVTVGSAGATGAVQLNTISGVGLILNGTNVGIGTTSPGYKLAVYGSTSGSEIVASFGNGNASSEYTAIGLSGFIASNGATKAGLALKRTGIYGTGELHFLNNNTLDNSDITLSDSKMMINASGNVGIGTTDPGSFRLNVHGDSTAGILSVKNAANGRDTFRSENAAGTRTVNIGNDGSGHGNVLIRNSAGTTTNYISGSGNSYLNGGRVGIGTTSPGAKLEIEGSSEPGIRLRETGGSNYYDIKTDGSIAWFGDRANSMKNLVVTAGGGAEIRTNGDLLAFKVENQAPAGSLYIKSTTGNVGIGTTGPTAPLHIEGGTNSEVLKIEADANPFIRWVENGTNVGFLQFLGDNAYLSNMSNGSFFFRTNNTDKMTITTGGNVGIGTTSPGKKLSIENGGFDMFAAGGTSADAFSVVTHNYVFSDENEDAVYSYANSEHEFSTQGFPRVTIDSVGLVGIGTTSPSSLLHVSGGELDVSGGNGYKIEDKPWAYWNSDLLTLGDWDGEGYSTRIMGSNSSEVMRVTGTNVGIGTTDPGTKLDVVASTTGKTWADYAGTVGTFERNGDSNINIISSNTGVGGVWFGDTDTMVRGRIRYEHASDRMELWTNNSEKVSITSGGNVGINEASPSYTLDVGGAIRGEQYLYLKDTGGTNRLTIQAESSYVTHSIGALAQNFVANYYRFYDDALSEMMRINEFGNVGIGTTSPDGKLHIDGISDSVSGLVLEASGTGDNRSIDFQNTSGALRVGLEYDNANINLDIVDRNRSKLVTFREGGNVGIGTTSPSYKLDVDGEVRVGDNQKLKLWDNAFSAIITPLDAHLALTTTRAQDNIYFDPGNSTKVVMEAGGNVGIGANSPSSKLHVKDTSLSGTLAYFEATASAMGSTNVRVDCLQYGTGISFFRDGSVGSGACSFRNDSGTQVGSIAIGTSSTSYNTSSDYRLKENLTSITDGIDRLKQLKPKRFNFIGETQIVDGFVAHEAKEVVPESVTGEKDEVLQNGDPVYQGIDQAKIVPLLTAALQEAVAKIEDLENRIQTLENK